MRSRTRSVPAEWFSLKGVCALEATRRLVWDPTHEDFRVGDVTCGGHQRKVVRRGGPKLSVGSQDGTRCHHGRLPKSSTARPSLGIAVADVDWRKDRHERLPPLPSDSDILKTIIQNSAFGRARAHDTLDRHKADHTADRR